MFDGCETPAYTSQWTQGIPIEVAPFAYAKVLTNLADMGSPATLPSGKPGLTLRMGKMKAGPVVSDNGMFIIDAPFPPELMAKPEEVGHGVLFSQVSSAQARSAGDTRRSDARNRFRRSLTPPAPAQDQDAHRCRRGRPLLQHGPRSLLWQRGESTLSLTRQLLTRFMPMLTLTLCRTAPSLSGITMGRPSSYSRCRMFRWWHEWDYEGT